MTLQDRSMTMPSRCNQEARCGRKSNIYQPPKTPSTTALSQSTVSLYNDSDSECFYTNGSKKRSRFDFDAQDAHRQWERPSYCVTSKDNSLMSNSGDNDFTSPVPFATTKYRLAGGLDTPGTLRAKEEEARDSVYFDQSFRRDLGGARRPEEEEEEETAEEAEYTACPRIQHTVPSAENGDESPTQREGWGFVQTIGGVVGKVIEFCKNAPFRGFAAGGGAAYASNASPIEVSTMWRRTSMNEESRYAPSPIPGQYPVDDNVLDYISQITSEGVQAIRPAKRRQIAGFGDEDIDKSWVMVQDENTPPPSVRRRSVSPNKAQSRFAISASSSRRLTGIPAFKASGARRNFTSRSPTAAYNSTIQPFQASLPSPRTPTTSRLPRLSTTQSTPPTSKIPRISSFSAASSGNTKSPAGYQAAKWAAQKRAEEKDADDTMKRFNKQLKDMIREGKEALGSKVEVYDEGFEDDT